MIRSNKQTYRQRPNVYLTGNSNVNWADYVKSAYVNRINLITATSESEETIKKSEALLVGWADATDRKMLSEIEWAMDAGVPVIIWKRMGSEMPSSIKRSAVFVGEDLSEAIEHIIDCVSS